jgi:hypothetical protein
LTVILGRDGVRVQGIEAATFSAATGVTKGSSYTVARRRG